MSLAERVAWLRARLERWRREEEPPPRTDLAARALAAAEARRAREQPRTRPRTKKRKRPSTCPSDERRKRCKLAHEPLSNANVHVKREEDVKTEDTETSIVLPLKLKEEVKEEGRETTLSGHDIRMVKEALCTIAEAVRGLNEAVQGIGTGTRP